MNPLEVAKGPAPLVRCCALCGQTHIVEPLNEEHRRAHLSRQIAYVCPDCAGRVRMEVEAAAGLGFEEPKRSA